jgi:hypothetical protein
MKSRIIAALLAVSVCTLAASPQSTPAPARPTADASSIAPPAHPATEAQIREYLTLNHAIDTAHQLIKDELRTSRATSAPYFTPGFWDDMETALMQIDLVPYFVPAYQKYFSEEDMAATIAFYKSPAGQHLLAAQASISSAAKESLTAAGRAAGIEVGKKHADEIERLMKQQQPAGQPSIPVPNLSR